LYILVVAVVCYFQAGRAALTCAEGRVRTDRHFQLACLKTDGNALEVAPFELCNDPVAVLVAVQHSKGGALQHASQRLRSDVSFVSQCVDVDGRALAYAAPPLRLLPALVAAAARRTSSHGGGALHFREVAEEAVAASRAASPRKGLSSPVASPRGPGDVGSPGSPHATAHRAPPRCQPSRGSSSGGSPSGGRYSGGARSFDAASFEAASPPAYRDPTRPAGANAFGWTTTKTPAGTRVRTWAPVPE
jgi:hypothetical protein